MKPKFHKGQELTILDGNGTLIALTVAKIDIRKGGIGYEFEGGHFPIYLQENTLIRLLEKTAQAMPLCEAS